MRQFRVSTPIPQPVLLDVARVQYLESVSVSSDMPCIAQTIDKHLQRQSVEQRETLRAKEACHCRRARQRNLIRFAEICCLGRHTRSSQYVQVTWTAMPAQTLNRKTYGHTTRHNADVCVCVCVNTSCTNDYNPFITPIHSARAYIQSCNVGPVCMQIATTQAPRIRLQDDSHSLERRSIGTLHE